MDLFERLVAEHRLIHEVTHALDRFVDSLHDDGSANLHEVIRFITFFRGFADGLHHAREETVLLPTLALVGLASDHGPLAYIHLQHAEGAELLHRFEKAAAAPPPWEDETIPRITKAAHALTEFERTHMGKEREILFPFARKELAAHTEAVAAAAGAFQRSRAPRWDPPWLEELGHALVAAHPA